MACFFISIVIFCLSGNKSSEDHAPHDDSSSSSSKSSKKSKSKSSSSGSGSDKKKKKKKKHGKSSWVI